MFQYRKGAVYSVGEYECGVRQGVRGAEKKCDANFNANLKIGCHADEVENFVELRVMLSCI